MTKWTSGTKHGKIKMMILLFKTKQNKVGWGDRSMVKDPEFRVLESM